MGSYNPFTIYRDFSSYNRSILGNSLKDKNGVHVCLPTQQMDSSCTMLRAIQKKDVTDPIKIYITRHTSFLGNRSRLVGHGKAESRETKTNGTSAKPIPRPHDSDASAGHNPLLKRLLHHGCPHSLQSS